MNDPKMLEDSLLSPAAWRAMRSGLKPLDRQAGRWGYALAWLLGVPIPILLIVYLLRGCS